MQGRVTQVHAGKRGELIPAGTPIEIRFDKPITQANFTLLPEVAVNLEVKILDHTGKEIMPDARKRFATCVGNSAQVIARLVLPRGVAVPPGLKDVKTSFTYGGSTIPLTFNPATNTFTGTVKVASGETPISSRVEYAGYINILDNGFTKGREDCSPRKFTLAAEQGGVRTQNWSADVRDLCDDRAAPLELYLEDDGKRLTPQEVKTWQATIDPSSGIKMRLTPTRNGQGWQLLPQSRFGSSCFTPTGTYPLQAAVNGKSVAVASAKEKPVLLTIQGKGVGPQDSITPANVTLDIKNPGWLTRCWLLIAKCIAFIILALWIIVAFRKPLFSKGSMIEFERTGPGAKRDYEYLSCGPFKRLFNRMTAPLVPRDKKTVDGIVFIATRSPSEILVSYKSIRQLGEGLTFNGRVKQPPVDRDEKINTISRVEFRAGDSRTVYKYVRPARGSGRKRH